MSAETTRHTPVADRRLAGDRVKTVALDTLGCKLNHYETAGIGDQFERKGFQIVPFNEPADVYVVNTCTVTTKTEKTGRQLVRRAQRQNPDATIVVTGCYVQYNPKEVAEIPGVHLVVGNADKDRILDLLEEDWSQDDGPLIEVNEFEKDDPFISFPMTRFPGYTRGFVKIQDGCNLRCAYCAIRIGRGRHRSDSPARILEHIEKLIQSGFEEIVLTGVHMTDYGRDLRPRTTLATLMQQIASMPKLGRVRLSSIEPLGVTDHLLEVLAGSDKICHTLHLALQSGSNTVLRRMRRRYTANFYRSVVEKLRKLDPEFCIGADVMVGFPGETEEEHRESLEFIRDIDLNYLHVFNYSTREGTEAAKHPEQVPHEVRARRSKEMRALHDELRGAYMARAEGRTYECIVLDSKDKESGLLRALSGHYVEALVEGKPTDMGKLVPVRIDRVEEQTAYGTILARPYETLAIL